jgi:hypothetical protein
MVGAIEIMETKMLGPLVSIWGSKYKILPEI